MSTENVETVRRGLEQYLATGEPPWELFDEEVVVNDYDTPDQGQYEGHAGVRRWLADWAEAWAEWSLEPEELVDAGDSVVVFIRMKTKGLGSGVEVERADAQVFKLSNGKFVRVDYYNDRAQALRAVGLDPA
jgi:ketosteroid isomerase-like protein